MDPESYDHIANFADDFLGGADTMDELLDHFEEFLKMCLEAGITLNRVRKGTVLRSERGTGEDHPSRTKPRPYTENDQA